jgi:hypothetical protein
MKLLLEQKEPEGNKIILTSNSPLNGKGKPSLSYHTWIVMKSGSGWGEPILPGSALKNIGYPMLANSGYIYFFCYQQDCKGRGKGNIRMPRYING